MSYLFIIYIYYYYYSIPVMTNLKIVLTLIIKTPEALGTVS
jgi:hypothetical protein